MGCWNQTCVITRMPIIRDEPCRLIFLGSCGERAGAFTQARSLYQPLGRAIKGAYDELGMINFEGDSERAEFVRQIGFFDYDGDFFGSYPHEPASEFIHSDIRRYFSRGKARLKGTHFNEVRGSFCLISEVAYAKLVDDVRSVQNWISSILYPLALTEYTALKAREDDADLSAMIVKSTDFTSFFTVENFFTHHIAKHCLQIGIPRGLRDLVLFGFGMKGPRHFLSGLRPGLTLLDHMLEIGELHILDEFLDHTRGLWQNQAGQGNQDYNYVWYDKLIEMMQAKNEVYMKRNCENDCS